MMFSFFLSLLLIVVIDSPSVWSVVGIDDVSLVCCVGDGVNSSVSGMVAVVVVAGECRRPIRL